MAIAVSFRGVFNIFLADQFTLYFGPIHTTL